MSPFTAICLLLLALVCNTLSQRASNNVIQTSSGPVRGTEVRSYNGKKLTQYLGVPFAQPPVNDLRFKKPQPVEKSDKVLVADTMPPACIQYLEVPFPWYDFQDGKSEDCLYLNIWVPQQSSLFGVLGRNKLPVMFWIYGGGFTVGSNRKRLYEGRALAADGQVIIVTINYRMAAFGFLTSGTDEAPGNVGIYDQVEALKWVNKNIGAFGGDPNQVTLFGQSAGSISISLLCVSPLTKGLFHRVIMESGSAAYLFAENNTANIAKSQELAKALGCADEDKTISNSPEEVVSCLRDLDAMEIAKTLNSFHPNSARSFFPHYGDEVLPMNARQAIMEGKFHNVPVFIGNNKDEGAFQITTANPDVFGFFGEKDPKINKSYAESLLRGTFSNSPDADAVISHYLGDVADDDSYTIRERTYTAMGDYSLLCPTKYFAESYSKAGNDVYYYFFVHRPSTSPWAVWMGAVHYEEIQFVFGLPVQEPRNYTLQERVLSRRMMKMWTNFANNRKPTLSWPKYSRENPRYVDLDTAILPSTGRGPHEDNCDFFRGYFGFD